MYEEELSDVRHTDLLIRFAEACGHDPRACDGHRQRAPPSPAACRAGATRSRSASTSPSPPPRSWSVSSRRCRRSIAASTRCCSRSTASPRRRPSSSTSTSPPTRSTASAAIRSCSSTPTRPSCRQRCLQLVRHGAEARFSYTKALYDTYVAPERPTPPGPRAGARLTAVGAAADADHPLRHHRPRGHVRRGRRGEPAPRRDPQRLRRPVQVRQRQLRHRSRPGVERCRELHAGCAGANASALANCSIRATGSPARPTSTATSALHGIPSRSGWSEGRRVYDKLKQVWLAKDGQRMSEWVQRAESTGSMSDVAESQRRKVVIDVEGRADPRARPRRRSSSPSTTSASTASASSPRASSSTAGSCAPDISGRSTLDTGWEAIKQECQPTYECASSTTSCRSTRRAADCAEPRKQTASARANRGDADGDAAAWPLGETYLDRRAAPRW